VTQAKLQAVTQAPRHYLPLRDLAVGICSLLPHTPIKTLGLPSFSVDSCVSLLTIGGSLARHPNREALHVEHHPRRGASPRPYARAVELDRTGARAEYERPQHVTSTRRTLGDSMRTVIFGFIVLTCTVASAQRNISTPTIETEIVGSWNGLQITSPTAINNRGEVAGYAGPTGDSFGYDAFVWTRATGFQLIAEEAIALAINNRGDVIGHRMECEGFSCAPTGFLWNARTGLTDLGDFLPRAINNNGDMAGLCQGPGVSDACAIHNGVRTVWTCGLPDCGQEAAGINERGDAVGARYDPLNGVEYAMLFPRRGNAVILSTGIANDINNSGLIAGHTPNPPTANATLWSRSDRRVLSTENYFSTAIAVNSRGWTVGRELVSDSSASFAFFWDGVETSPVYLAPAAFRSAALDINDRGVIVGTINDGPIEQFAIWQVRP
jgi:uncharacterized membrane protein